MKTNNASKLLLLLLLLSYFSFLLSTPTVTSTIGVCGTASTTSFFDDTTPIKFTSASTAKQLPDGKLLIVDAHVLRKYDPQTGLAKIVTLAWDNEPDNTFIRISAGLADCRGKAAYDATRNRYFFSCSNKLIQIKGRVGKYVFYSPYASVTLIGADFTSLRLNDIYAIRVSNDGTRLDIFAQDNDFSGGQYVDIGVNLNINGVIKTNRINMNDPPGKSVYCEDVLYYTDGSTTWKMMDNDGTKATLAIDIKYEIICGHTNNMVYLVDGTGPGDYWIDKYNLQTDQSVRINFALESKQVVWSSANMLGFITGGNFRWYNVGTDSLTNDIARFAFADQESFVDNVNTALHLPDYTKSVVPVNHTHLTIFAEKTIRMYDLVLGRDTVLFTQGKGFFEQEGSSLLNGIEVTTVSSQTNLHGIAVDSLGNIYMPGLFPTSFVANRILKLTPVSDTKYLVSNFVGTGSSSFFVNGAYGTHAFDYGLYSRMVIKSPYLYMGSDATRGQISRFHLTTRVMETVVQHDAASVDGPAATTARVQSIIGMHLSPDGNQLVFSDKGVIRALDFTTGNVTTMGVPINPTITARALLAFNNTVIVADGTQAGPVRFIFNKKYEVLQGCFSIPTVCGVASDTSKYVDLEQYNGEVLFVTPTCVQTFIPGPPSAPPLVEYEANSTSIVLSAIPDASTWGGLEITQIHVRYMIMGSVSWTTTTFKTFDPIPLTNLQPETYYVICVSITNNLGSSKERCITAQTL